MRLFRDHVFPLLAAACVLALMVVTLPIADAMAQGVTGFADGTFEPPASLLSVPFIGDALRAMAHWAPVVFAVVGAFSIIASMTANETDDKIVNWILKIINFAGFNFGTAKNDPTVATSKPKVPEPPT